MYLLGFVSCRSGSFDRVKILIGVLYGHVRSPASVCWTPGVLPMDVSADLLLGWTSWVGSADYCLMFPLAYVIVYSVIVYSVILYSVVLYSIDVDSIILY